MLVAAADGLELADCGDFVAPDQLGLSTLNGRRRCSEAVIENPLKPPFRLLQQGTASTV
jgi:hypothetical protein